MENENKYKEIGCEFKNEIECEEELEDEGTNTDKEESDYYEED